MAMMMASTGLSLVISVCLAELPEAVSTISSIPAPTLSTAMTNPPVNLPFRSTCLTI